MIDLHSKTYISWHFMKSALATHRRNFKLCAKKFCRPSEGEWKNGLPFIFLAPSPHLVRSLGARALDPSSQSSELDRRRSRSSVSQSVRRPIYSCFSTFPERMRTAIGVQLYVKLPLHVRFTLYLPIKVCIKGCIILAQDSKADSPQF